MLGHLWAASVCVSDYSHFPKLLPAFSNTLAFSLVASIHLLLGPPRIPEFLRGGGSVGLLRAFPQTLIQIQACLLLHFHMLCLHKNSNTCFTSLPLQRICILLLSDCLCRSICPVITSSLKLLESWGHDSKARGHTIIDSIISLMLNTQFSIFFHHHKQSSNDNIMNCLVLTFANFLETF